MTGAEGVMFAFFTAGEAGKPTVLAQRIEALAAAGEKLVNVALVPYVPDNLILRAVENAVEGNGEFDNAQVGSQMSAGTGHRGDDFMP